MQEEKKFPVWVIVVIVVAVVGAVAWIAISNAQGEAEQDTDMVQDALDSMTPNTKR